MANYNPEILKYIKNASEFERPILTKLREIIHKACPEVEEKLSWSRPHYYYKGKGMLVTDGLKERVTFGVWFDDKVYGSPKLSKEAKSIHEQLGFMKSVDEIPDEKLLIETIKLAMEVIDEGRTADPKKKKAALVIPDYFSDAVAQDKLAKENFDKMSPSHQREYVEWIVDAKTEETRNRRIEQMLDQLRENKSKHWKYQK